MRCNEPQMRDTNPGGSPHRTWQPPAPSAFPEAAVEPAGTNRYRVSHTGSGQSAIVDLTQPLGPNGIWVVTSVTPLATTAAG